MRIAILEPEPRVCGPMSWAWHCREGFVRLGHECHVVTSTKSGDSRVSWGSPRQGARWCARPPDICVRDDALAELLSSYDGVILPEPRNPLHDARALRDGCRPAYVEASLACGRTVVSTLRGNDYTEEGCPFMRDLLPLAKRHVTYSPRSTESLPEWAREWEWRLSPKPYVLGVPFDRGPDVPAVTCRADGGRELVTWPARGREDAVTVGYMGRVTWNKGPQVGLWASLMVDSDLPLHFELWGATSVGLGASPSIELWERLLAKGLVGVRYGQEPGTGRGGDTIKPWPWEAKTDSFVARYFGNYMNGVETAARMQAVVLATSPTFSGGLVEFTGLEAMEAGTTVIAPKSCMQLVDSGEAFAYFELRGMDGTVTPAGFDAGKGNELLEYVADLLCMAIDARPRDLRDARGHNRGVIERACDPKLAATVLLEAMS